MMSKPKVTMIVGKTVIECVIAGIKDENLILSYNGITFATPSSHRGLFGLYKYYYSDSGTAFLMLRKRWHYPFVYVCEKIRLFFSGANKKLIDQICIAIYNSILSGFIALLATGMNFGFKNWTNEVYVTWVIIGFLIYKCHKKNRL